MMTRLDFLRALGVAAATVPLVAATSVPLVACKQDDGVDPPASDAGNQATPDASTAGANDAATDAATDAPIQPPTCNGTGVAFATNHGHMMSVSLADVTAGVDKTYQIQGTALHPHTVLVTAASFATLKATGSVTVMSSLDAMHQHAITVTCTA